MNAPAVFLHVESCEVEWAEGRTRLSDLVAQTKSGYCIVQTFRELYFEEFTGSVPELFEASFEGRIFDTLREIRWVRQDGSWLFSVLAENDWGDQPLEPFDQRYYLWGEYDAAMDVFRETRIPRTLRYPLPASLRPADHDRAYITVREYRVTSPPTGITATDDTMDFLNRPFVAHHRYLGLGVGQEKES